MIVGYRLGPLCLTERVSDCLAGSLRQRDHPRHQSRSSEIARLRCSTGAIGPLMTKTSAPKSSRSTTPKPSTGPAARSSTS